MERLQSPPTVERAEHYRRLQVEMAGKVREEPLRATPRVIAAVDIHLRGDRGIAVAVTVSYAYLETIEERIANGPVTFPYIPGLLSLREAPLCLEAIQSLSQPPDLMLVGGQGRAHPRRCGIACHLGVELNISAIGVAKSILTGRSQDLEAERGATTPLRSRREVVGVAVRTCGNVTPVYVSVGNLITLAEAVEWTLRTTTRYRLPEPSRRAHHAAQQLARGLR